MARLTNRRTVLERNHDKVRELVLEGLTDAEVAAALSDKRVTVSRQAVTAYRHRHAEELERVTQEAVKQIEDYAIAHKVKRIAGLDALRQRIEAVIDDRGLIERTITTTEHAEIVRERFARELPAELRAVYRAAAEETGQIQNGSTVNIDNRTQILVRYVEGPQ